MNNRKKLWLSLAGLIVLALVFVSVYFSYKKPADQSSKSVEIEIVYQDKSSKTKIYETEATNLEELLMDEKLASGTQSQTGLFIDTVDGIKADWNDNQAWWKIQINHEDAAKGASSIVLEDGNTYSLIYTEG